MSYDKRLTRLPDRIGHLKTLTVLNLSGCDLKVVPDRVVNAQNILRVLNRKEQDRCLSAQIVGTINLSLLTNGD